MSDSSSDKRAKFLKDFSINSFFIYEAAWSYALTDDFTHTTLLLLHPHSPSEIKSAYCVNSLCVELLLPIHSISGLLLLWSLSNFFSVFSLSFALYMVLWTLLLNEKVLGNNV